MGALHSRGKAHPLSHTKKVVEDVFQRPFEDVFEEFRETPIGTGAIAQVGAPTFWLRASALTGDSFPGISGDSQAGPPTPILLDVET